MLATDLANKGPKFDKVMEIWDKRGYIHLLHWARKNMRRGCYYGDASELSHSILCNIGSFYIIKIIRESYGEYHRAVLKQDFA